MNDAAGKKVFFLYPPSVLRDELIIQLVEQEFEVYMLGDHVLATRILHLFPDSILYVNLDANLEESEWETWIRATMADPVTASVGIGIVSYNADENLQRKYLMDIGIQCGFIKLKLGLEESTHILLATLNANEAKGRRKYVRATCTSDKMSSVNIIFGNQRITGNILDISVVGFSCTFNQDTPFIKNMLLKNVQLKLRGSLMQVDVIVFGMRNDENPVFVMLFAQGMEPANRKKIRAYLQIALQSELDLHIKNAEAV